MQVFSWEFCKIFKYNFFMEYIGTTVSITSKTLKSEKIIELAFFTRKNMSIKNDQEKLEGLKCLGAL